MAAFTPTHIEIFLQDRSDDLKRIARGTQGEVSFEDLGSEAWLIAGEIADRRGSAVDFADLDDQEQVLSWLYVRFVRRADMSIRYAERLDKESRDDDGKKVQHLLMNLLTAPETSDPLLLLQTTEEQKEYIALIRASYSQATAYLLILLRFGRNDLAIFLQIAVATLAGRIRRAADRFRVQPSMFDGIEAIDEEFMPAPGLAKRKIARPARQSSWDLWPSHVWQLNGGRQ